jgi:hypothetical protein
MRDDNKRVSLCVDADWLAAKDVFFVLIVLTAVGAVLSH